eukprot:6702963-Pyramimonas_sp.AAC.2
MVRARVEAAAPSDQVYLGLMDYPYPPVVNQPELTEFVRKVSEGIVGKEAQHFNEKPVMGGEVRPMHVHVSTNTNKYDTEGHRNATQMSIIDNPAV